MCNWGVLGAAGHNPQSSTRSITRGLPKRSPTNVTARKCATVGSAGRCYIQSTKHRQKHECQHHTDCQSAVPQMSRRAQVSVQLWGCLALLDTFHKHHQIHRGRHECQQDRQTAKVQSIKFHPTQACNCGMCPALPGTFQKALPKAYGKA